jgi:hypothetical protein
MIEMEDDPVLLPMTEDMEEDISQVLPRSYV